jgi:hypothetical protein
VVGVQVAIAACVSAAQLIEHPLHRQRGRG